MGTSPPAVRAGQFEGPLDLLLALVRQQRVELDELPVAAVTKQYLDYLAAAERADVELGAEFIYMAATLIQLKSAAILPRDPALGAPEPASDPRRTLIERLREHMRTVDAATHLEQRLAREGVTWSNPPSGAAVPSEVAVDAPSGPRKASLADLIDVLGTAMARSVAAASSRLLIDSDPFTMQERIAWLRAALSDCGLPAAASGLFAAQPSRGAAACLLLGMLELARAGEVRLEQHEAFGEIMLH